jgi:hypothetical protein
MNDKSTVILTTMASKTLMVVAQTGAFTFTPHLVSFYLLEGSFTKGRISVMLYQATNIKLWPYILHRPSFH